MLLSLILLLTACQAEVTTNRTISAAVWADDEQSLALLIEETRALPPPWPWQTPQTEITHYFYEEDLNGRRSLLTSTSAPTLDNLFFMHRAGYVLWQESARLQVFRLDGRLQSRRLPTHTRVLPDPTGQTLAEIRRNADCAAETDLPPRPDCLLQITFLNPNDLQVLSQQSLRFPAPIAPLSIVWQSQRTLLITDGLKAYVLGPQLAVLPADVPPCLPRSPGGEVTSSRNQQIIIRGSDISLEAVAPDPAICP